MSYFPDYRKETDKLNEVDRAFIAGYRKATEDMLCFFDNYLDEDMLTVEKEVISKVKESLEAWMEGEEVVAVCSLFCEADYLPEDIELKDANASLFGK